MQRILPWLAASYLALASAPLVVRAAEADKVTPVQLLERVRRKLPVGRYQVSDRARLNLIWQAQRRARLEAHEPTLMDQRQLWEAQRKRELRADERARVAAVRLAA